MLLIKHDKNFVVYHALLTDEMDCCDASLMAQVIENVKDCFANGNEFEQPIFGWNKEKEKDLAYM